MKQGNMQAPRLPLTIQLLGGFHVRVNGQIIPDESWRQRKSRTLVKLLALAPGHRLHRDQLIDQLWPETEPRAAANLFYQALHAARKVLDPSGSLGQSYLYLQDEQLHLCPENPLVVDVEAFEQQTVLARKGRDPATYLSALDLYTGDLLPEDPYEEWTLLRRAALREEYLKLLFELAELYEENQLFEPAIAVLNKITAIDSTHEDAYVLLMQLFARAGQRREAIQQYQKLKDALQKELAVEPSAETTRLYDEILHARAAREARSNAAPASRPLQNLPSQISSFIGREKEISEVSKLLSDHRLVTVTGAGGTGKTRLALQTAEHLLAQYADGVWLVELAPVADPSLVTRVVAETLGISEEGGLSLQRVLELYIQSHHLLLILDNCEHVLSGAAGLAAQILHDCPNLHILATSREILGVEGEISFYCPSLSLPDRLESLSLEETLQSEAVRLFVERARSARPDFSLGEENAALIGQICRRLDGIPLAIELAAARVRMLSIEQIASRLERDFHLLTSGSRSALPRHQTLKALIDWSYNLLAPEERALLLGLSIFAGGWTMEAAEDVCAYRETGASSAVLSIEEVYADSEGNETRPVRLQSEQIVELTGHLIDKSLIRFEPASNGEPRYYMLETVRQYAQEKLVQRGEVDLLRERHLNYYLSLALSAEPHLRAFGAKYWLDRFDRELDNLRLALEWSLIGSVERGLQLAIALFWFWWIRGHGMEGAGWLVRLLQEQKNRYGSLDVAGKVARGRALNALFDGNFLNIGAVPDILVQQRQALCLESKTIFQELGHDYLRDFAISRLHLADCTEEIQECRRLFQEANEPFWVYECDNALSFSFPIDDERNYFYAKEGLALAKESGDLDGQAVFIYYIGMLEFYRENKDLAVERVEEAMACFELIGNRAWAAHMRGTLFLFSIDSGNHREAYEQLELMRNIAQEIKRKFLSIRYIEYRAYAAWTQMEDALAVYYCEQAQELDKGFNSGRKLIYYYVLGRVALSLGDLARAAAYLMNYIQSGLYKFSWDARAVQALGVLATKEGQMQRAALLFGSQIIPNAWSLKISSSRERGEYEQALAAARAALGEETFTAAWEAGRAMTTEQVIQYALEGFPEAPNHDEEIRT